MSKPGYDPGPADDTFECSGCGEEYAVSDLVEGTTWYYGQKLTVDRCPDPDCETIIWSGDTMSDEQERAHERRQMGLCDY